MGPIFKIILIALLTWPALVSLTTGRIYLRSGPTQKNWMPRAFGACILLAAIVLSLHWTGLLPPSLQGAVTPVVALLLVVATILPAVFWRQGTTRRNPRPCRTTGASTLRFPW